ncbi:hypothetical protein VKS41_004223 [Umbelopsis sp. WA50703]|jgi:hypothetical protein
MPAIIKRETPIAAKSRKSGRVTKKSARSPPAQWIKSRESSTEIDHNTSDIKRMEKELAFSNDTLATIVVMIESLQRAYDSRLPDQPMEGRTRLNAAERELLAEYDDLDLQMSHLEKKISAMETALAQLKGASCTDIKIEQVPAVQEVDQWEHLQYFQSEQDASLSPQQLELKLEDMADWIDWTKEY